MTALLAWIALHYTEISIFLVCGYINIITQIESHSLKTDLKETDYINGKLGV